MADAPLPNAPLLNAPLMLHIENLHVHQAQAHVLRGVQLQVHQGEMVCLLGRNGSGRTTLLKAIMGLVAARGHITFQGHSLLGLPAFKIARLGLGYVPASRDIFPHLSVQQNLQLGVKPTDPRVELRPSMSARWSLADAYNMYPQLKQRQHTEASRLSGGEQQMLALSRTLMGNPDLILMDEPTEGLAPQWVQQVALQVQTLQARGVSVLVAEQKLAWALDIAQRCCVMGQGCVVFDGTPAALQAQQGVREEWLMV
jgi:branched-chain amino acid transport system ATP-binding protein